MFKMQYTDGTTITLTGADAKDASTAVKQSIHDHAVLMRVDRTTAAIKKDTAKLVKAIPEEVAEQLDEILVTGTRRREAIRAKELHAEHPKWKLYRCATAAHAEAKGPDPFSSVKELDNYLRRHVAWFNR